MSRSLIKPLLCPWPCWCWSVRAAVSLPGGIHITSHWHWSGPSQYLLTVCSDFVKIKVKWDLQEAKWREVTPPDTWLLKRGKVNDEDVMQTILQLQSAVCCDAAVLQCCREVWVSEVVLTTSFLFNYLNKSWQWSRLGWAGLGWAGAINHPRAELIMDTFQPAWAAPTSPAQLQPDKAATALH